MGVASERTLPASSGLLRRPCCVRAALHCLSARAPAAEAATAQRRRAPSLRRRPRRSRHDTAAPGTGTLVVGTALSIDGGASGNPVSLRVARSANGDGFAVWQADDGTRRNLWANRYAAATAAWAARSTSRRAAATSTTSISRSMPAVTRRLHGTSPRAIHGFVAVW